MANFTQAGYVSPGIKITVDGSTTPPVAGDTLKLNGVKLTIAEWIKRGILRTVGTSGNITTYQVDANPENSGTQAGG